jgi:predicted dehydrogenase
LQKTRLAVVGAGAFGKNHVRVIHESGRAELAAVVDIDAARAGELASLYGAAPLTDFRTLSGKVDAAIVAVPTSQHAAVACALLEAGIHVLVEKPVASDLASADRLIEASQAAGRILQVGHLERFNPAVLALQEIARQPLFFEIHRLSQFSLRSLDVDVVLDLMIHDLDIVLTLAKAEPDEIRAAGISILSPKVDIANVRLQFPGGCVANLTASRVSTERVRKLRLFQPRQYISLDYSRQDGAVFTVGKNRDISSARLPVTRKEPLALQLDSFLDSIATRSRPKVDGKSARLALKVALAIAGKIEEHSQVVAQSLAANREA